MPQQVPAQELQQDWLHRTHREHGGNIKEHVQACSCNIKQARSVGEAAGSARSLQLLSARVWGKMLEFQSQEIAPKQRNHLRDRNGWGAELHWGSVRGRARRWELHAPLCQAHQESLTARHPLQQHSRWSSSKGLRFPPWFSFSVHLICLRWPPMEWALLFWCNTGERGGPDSVDALPTGQEQLAGCATEFHPWGTCRAHAGSPSSWDAHTHTHTLYPTLSSHLTNKLFNYSIPQGRRWSFQMQLPARLSHTRNDLIG